MLNEPINKGRKKVPSIRKAGMGAAPSSTMNRPDSETLNTNATATAAAQVYAKEQAEGQPFMPAIATGILPPVPEEKKADAKVNSPFKAPPKGPIKRPKNAANIAYQQEEHEKEKEEPAEPVKEEPQIAKFMAIPVLKEPPSPFKPIGEQQNNGLKAPIKRSASASLNHASAQNEKQEAAPSEADKPVYNPNSAFKPMSISQVGKTQPSPFKPLKTSDKTFIPLAPVPYYHEAEEEEEDDDAPSPFAKPVKKTEEQIRKEEEAARIALEQSRSGGKKKSKLDKLMDELNRPIF